MLLQREAMVMKKLLVDDKITACGNQVCLLGVICKVYELLIRPQSIFLECIVILW